MKRVLIFGGSGQLGSEMVEVFGGFAPSHNILSVCDYGAVYETITTYNPDLVINCTAYHNVGECEKHPRTAHAMNCEVVKNMVNACNKVDATFVHFSTDYVFDGKKGSPYYENDAVNPLNEYGRSKVCGEQYILDNSKDFIIGRVSSLFGKLGHSNKGLNFVEKVLNSEVDMPVVNDQIMSPTYCEDVAMGLKLLLSDDFRGVVHMNNGGCCSWYEFACKIKEMAGLSIDIIPVKSSTYKTPRNSSMSSNVYYGPHWIKALAHYLYSRGRISYE